MRALAFERTVIAAPTRTSWAASQPGLRAQLLPRAFLSEGLSKRHPPCYHSDSVPRSGSQPAPAADCRRTTEFPTGGGRVPSAKPDTVSREHFEPSNDEPHGRQQNAGRQPISDRGRHAPVTVPCSACDQPASISFQPREGEPVYCTDCFQPQPRSIDHAMRRNTRPTGFAGNQRWSNGWQGSGQRGNRRP